jgi:hypothetical protein
MDDILKESGEWDGNSNLAMGGFVPHVKKLLPFPLENVEEDLADIYFNMDKVRKRIEVVRRNNVTSLTVARLKHLRRMQYKINTAMSIIKHLTTDLDSFWVN